MPDFQYIAKELTGRQVTGVISAASNQDALALLAGRQLFPVKVDAVEANRPLLSFGGRRVSQRQLATLYAQLGDLLKSGVPLLRSLELLGKQAGTPVVRAILQDVREKVSDGMRLNIAMSYHKDVFGDLVISMVRAGEEGGFLEDVLKRVAVFTEHSEELKGRVVGAMIYPMFLLGTGGLVLSVLLVWFVPRFEEIFQKQKEQGDLPAATTLLLSMSRAAQTYWILIAAALIGAVLALRWWLNTEEGKLRMDQFRLRAYGIGRIVKSLAISRFCRVLGTLLSNGVPILPSLRIAKDATGNRVLTQAIADASDNISAGKSLARPLAASGQFPDEIVEMISVGEEANNLEEVLVNISENLERRTHRELELVVRMLEPILLMILAAIVLFVAIALLLPILQTSSLAG
jgi:general secretion pathway protein F/type IV pilus assembly protein PilC